MSDRFDFARYAAWNEAYTYPQVTRWATDEDQREVVALLGEMVTLEVKDFSNADVCVNDVLVSGPPVYRVSVTFWNETVPKKNEKADDEADDETPDGPTSATFEIELAATRNDTADELLWFTNWANPATLTDYNLARGTCLVLPIPIPERRRAEDTMATTSTEANVRVHTVGNQTDSLSFKFVSLGEPSDRPSLLSSDKYLNEVRASAAASPRLPRCGSPQSWAWACACGRN